LVDDLRQWIETKRNALSVVGIDQQGIDRKEPLFNVPRQLVKCLDRDLAAAGIAKVDDRGRTIDFHALRHTFGTLLSKGGVSPRTAQQAMRHSDIRLTMNTYTDPRLLDIAGAVDALPQLSITSTMAPNEATPLKATGTETGRFSVAPMVAPTSANLVQRRSIRDTFDGALATGRKTKKPLESQGKPRVSINRAGGIRTHDLYHPKVAR
jgi:hypothetical protein